MKGKEKTTDNKKKKDEVEKQKEIYGKYKFKERKNRNNIKTGIRRLKEKRNEKSI